MEELLKKVLIRLGLTYAGASVGIYLVSEQMVSAHVASIRNPSWRMILPLRQFIFWTWRMLLYAIMAFLSLVLIAMVLEIISEVIAHHQNRKQAKIDQIIAEEKRLLREVEDRKRETLRKQQILEESQNDSTPKPKPSIFSSSTPVNHSESSLSPEEVVRRTLESLKD